MTPPTFVRSCGEVLAHPEHVYSKVWRKVDLPNLYHPEQYPDVWTAQYRCPGVEVIAWTVLAAHEDCELCEQCADLAVQRALEDGSTSHLWVHDMVHRAEVRRV